MKEDKVIGYEITGTLYRSNKRFKLSYTDLRTALCINLWNGSVWARYENGKRKLLKRVHN